MRRSLREPGGRPPPRIGLRTTLVRDQKRRMIDTVAVHAEADVMTGHPARAIAGRQKPAKRMKGRR
jgi:hypothetical protein